MRSPTALLALLAISACAITSREATMDLPGTSWVLVDLDGAAPVGEPPPTLSFDEQGGVHGSTGCNRFSGEVTIEGAALTFGPLATTRMACLDPALGAQETTFLAAVESVSGYTIDDQGRLVLDGDVPLTFEVTTQGE
jgi:heat shock protein HslJ